MRTRKQGCERKSREGKSYETEIWVEEMEQEETQRQYAPGVTVENRFNHIREIDEEPCGLVESDDEEGEEEDESVKCKACCSATFIRQVTELI